MVLIHIDIMLYRLVRIQLVPTIVCRSAALLVADVGLVHVVSPLMIISVATRREDFRARRMVATVWFFTVVHPHVLH